MFILNQNIKAFAKGNKFSAPFIILIIILLSKILEIVKISPKQVRLIAGGSAQIKFSTSKPYKICEVTTPKNHHFVHNKNIPNEVCQLLHINT